MSIATEIQNYNDGLLDAYDAVATKGGTVPTQKNLANLPDAIESISGGGGGVGYNLEPFPTVELPTGYTRLEWIENQDYQSYIDTGVNADPHINFEIELMRTSVYQASGNSAIFGSSNNAGLKFGVFCSAAYPYNECVFGKFNASFGPTRVTGGFGKIIELQTNVWYKFESKFNYLNADNDSEFIDDQSYISVSGLIYVMQSNLRGGLDNFFNNHRVKYLALWNNQKIIRYFVPCKDDQDRVGLYDMVNEQFYPKQGTGAEFIAGPVVNEGNA